MDRLSSKLDRLEDSTPDPNDPVVGFGGGDEHLVAHSQHHFSIDRQLFELAELDVNALTPLQAINKLYEWKQRYTKT